MPLEPFAAPLRLTPVQAARIADIQKQGEEDMRRLSQQYRQEHIALMQQFPPTPLHPGSPLMQNPVIRETVFAVERLRAPWRQRRMRDLKVSLNRSSRANSLARQTLDSETAAAVFAILTDDQKKVLPALLQEARDMQAANIPLALYPDLNLNDAQKQKISGIVREAAHRRSQTIRVAVQATRESLLSGRRNDPRGVQQRLSAALKESTRKTHDQIRTLLTPPQRRLLLRSRADYLTGAGSDGSPLY